MSSTYDKLAIMKCDACGKETKEVRRVVVDRGYDRTLAHALYNCPECFNKKEKTRTVNPTREKPKDRS